jgi:hypothetical protein
MYTYYKMLQTHGGGIRNKMNKWIKSCLKFGLHSKTVLNGLSNFFSSTRNFFHKAFKVPYIPSHEYFFLFDFILYLCLPGWFRISMEIDFVTHML